MNPARIALVVVLLSLSAAPAEAATEVKLPSAHETIQAQIEAEQLLRGGRGPERTLPGDVEDRERVKVLIDSTGEPHAVVVDQRLTMGGTGDFFIKVPGPALDVEALPGSSSQPGLRTGSVVWQGFATEGEVLGARIELDPRNEASRLPVTVAIEGTVDGEPFDVLTPAAGQLDLTITLTNNTLRASEQLSAEPVDEIETAAALDAVHTALAVGERPEPGSAGIPRALAVGPIEETQADLVAPVQVNLKLRLPPSSTDVSVEPASLDDAGSETLELSALLSGTETSATVHVTATVPEEAVALSVTSSPAPPSPDEIEPPGTGTWVDAAEAGTAEGRAMFETLYRVLGEAARLPEIDGYLGNPDRDGPTSSAYTFVLRAPDKVEVAPTPAPSGVETDPLRIALVGVGLLIALAALAVWWALS